MSDAPANHGRFVRDERAGSSVMLGLGALCATFIAALLAMRLYDVEHGARRLAADLRVVEQAAHASRLLRISSQRAEPLRVALEAALSPTYRGQALSPTVFEALASAVQANLDAMPAPGRRGVAVVADVDGDAAVTQWSADGGLWVGTAQGALSSWSNGRRVAQWPGAQPGGVRAIVRAPSGDTYAARGDDGTVSVWQATQRPRALEGVRAPVTAMCFSPDGARLLIAGGDSPGVWDLATGRRLVTLTAVPAMVLDARWTADRRHLVLASADGARVYDATTYGLVHTLAHAGVTVTAMAVSPDSARVVTGGADGLARMWNLHSGAELTTMALGSTIRVIDYSPDGHRMLLAGDGDQAVIWGVFQIHRELTLDGLRGPVRAGRYTTDQGRVVLLDASGALKVFHAHAGDLMATIPAEGATDFSLSTDGARAAVTSGARAQVVPVSQAGFTEVACAMTAGRATFAAYRARCAETQRAAQGP